MTVAPWAKNKSPPNQSQLGPAAAVGVGEAVVGLGEATERATVATEIVGLILTVKAIHEDFN